MKVVRGQRKLKEVYFIGALLFAGFCVACYFKIDSSLYSTFVAGLAAKGFAFMWGNSNEHKYDFQKATLEVTKTEGEK